MKKIFILFVFIFAFFLVSCDKVLDESQHEILDETITTKIDELINASSYETQLHFHMVTDEMEISISPLLSLSKYTDDNGKEVYKALYYNKIMEGMGLEEFAVIIDERDEMVYLNNTQGWYTGSFAEVQEVTEMPIFDYLFNLEDQLEEEEATNIETVKNIIIDGLKSYNQATYIDEFEENNRKLVHYELEYNVYGILEDIFDYLNEEEELEYDDFVEFIEELEIEDIMDLFKEFKVDFYFDIEKDNDIARIEIDLMNILGNSVISDKIQEEIDDQDIDVAKMLEYVQHLEIGINIYNLNSLEEITISNEAQSGYPISYLDAPFDPDELEEISLGEEDTIVFEDYDCYWYKFTLTESTNISISSNSEIDPQLTIYDSDFDWYGYNTNIGLGEGNYYDFNYVEELPQGTYYFKVDLSDLSSFGSVDISLNVEE